MIARCLLATAGVLFVVLAAGCDAPSTQPDHALVGRQAPLFTATTLGDEPFDLGAHQGKIVILDFWATWCPPCRAALPVLSEVAAEYKDRGIEFYAVDVGEDAEEVKKFVDESMPDLPVVLDRDGSVSEKYLVEYLPQTVIIGSDGRVAFVHVGSSGDLKAELSHDLDSLLSGPPTAQVPQRGSAGEMAAK